MMREMLTYREKWKRKREKKNYVKRDLLFLSSKLAINILLFHSFFLVLRSCDIIVRKLSVLSLTSHNRL
jgi:hypothetical protein